MNNPHERYRCAICKTFKTLDDFKDKNFICTACFEELTHRGGKTIKDFLTMLSSKNIEYLQYLVADKYMLLFEIIKLQEKIESLETENKSARKIIDTIKNFKG